MRKLIEGKIILDIGCGTGIAGIVNILQYCMFSFLLVSFNEKSEICLFFRFSLYYIITDEKTHQKSIKNIIFIIKTMFDVAI